MCSLILHLHLHLNTHRGNGMRKHICTCKHSHVPCTHITKKQEDIAVMLQTCTEKVPSLNLSWGINMTNEVYMVFLILSRQIREYLDYVMTASFLMLTNSSITNDPTTSNIYYGILTALHCILTSAPLKLKSKRHSMSHPQNYNRYSLILKQYCTSQNTILLSAAVQNLQCLQEYVTSTLEFTKNNSILV